jgi:HupE/UreJ protein
MTGRRLLALLACVAASSAFAHEPSRSLLTLTVDGDVIRGHLDVSLRDLEEAVGLDADADAAISWGEVKAREQDIVRYAAQRLRVDAAGSACELAVSQKTVDTHGGAAYAVLDLEGACPAAPRRVRVSYGLMFDVDPGHRSLVEIGAGGTTTSAVLSAEHRAIETDLASLSPWSSFARFAAEGVSHIWHGYDHLAFVALLVLPIVLGRGPGKRRSWRGASLEILRVVTAFTLAHSTTLALAALGVLDVPTRLVESAIALSVLLAAVLNVVPAAPRLGAKLAFGFGLVHGLGFATALGDLGARDAGMLASLLGFNAGVELGQIAVVAAALPMLLALRCSAFWRNAVRYAGSAACGALAVVWLAQRL